MKARTDSALGTLALVVGITFGIAAVALSAAMARPVSRKAILNFFGSRTAYAVGQTVDLPSNWFQGSRLTLVMFARGSCQACEKSVPAVSAMVAELRRHPEIRFILAATGDELPMTKALAARLGFAESEVVPLAVVDQQRMKLRAVPTFLALDDQGSIRVLAEGLQQVQRSSLGDEVVALVQRLK